MNERGQAHVSQAAECLRKTVTHSLHGQALGLASLTPSACFLYVFHIVDLQIRDYLGMFRKSLPHLISLFLSTKRS